MLRFGGMIEDLECYVDNSLRFSATGEVIGRERGVKGWLQMHIPALWVKYKTVMRYKAAAKKLRQVLELRDPMPISSILDNENLMRTKSKVESGGTDSTMEQAVTSKNQHVIDGEQYHIKRVQDHMRGKQCCMNEKQHGMNGEQCGMNGDLRYIGRNQRGVAALRARKKEDA